MNLSYSHDNLSGQSFKNQCLVSADFSYCDIRGADFSNADLTNADLRYSISGQRTRHILVSWVYAVLLSGLSGLLIGAASGIVGNYLVLPGNTDSINPVYYQVSSGIALFLIFTLAIIITKWGYGLSLGIFAASVMSMVVVVVVARTATPEPDIAAIMQALALAALVAGVTIGAMPCSFTRMKLGLRGMWITPSIMFITAVGAAFELTELNKLAGNFSKSIAMAVALGITMSMVFLAMYIGSQALNNADRYLFSRRFAILLSSLGGTRFRQANLEDADFTGANLNGADFRNAKLRFTCWFNAQNLEHAQLDTTYLGNPTIRQLVNAKDGSQGVYDHMNLRGLNLEGARLSGCSFIFSDLSESILSEADLSGAKLVQSQLYRTDLSRANLTGAFIQDWAISTDTRLDDVICDFVFMRLPTQDDPDPVRKPDSREEIFREGDFTDFIAPIVKTLHLYRQQNVDPRQLAVTVKTLDLFHHETVNPTAAAISLVQTAEKHPEALLGITALEGHANKRVRLQTTVSSHTDRSQLSSEYYERYREVASLSKEDIKVLIGEIAEKDRRITSLEQMVMAAMQSEKFYVETYYGLGDVIGGDKIDIGDVKGTGIAVGRGVNQSTSIDHAAPGQVAGE